MIPISSVNERRAIYLPAAKYVACLLLATVIGLVSSPCKAAKRGFTVADDIELVHFGNPAITFSPNGFYFVVNTERGLLGRNRTESTLRIFQTEDVRQFIL